MCKWKPLAPNGFAEGRFNFIESLCRLEASRLEVSSLQGSPSRTAAECLSSLPLSTLSLDKDLTGGQEG